MKGNELSVKARSSGCLLQLIPHRHLSDDFPRSLVADFDHWLDLKTGVVEFRPIENRWQSAANNWHLTIDLQSPSRCTMRRKGESLLDVRGRLACQITEILQRLDFQEHIHITQLADSTIRAKLVRLGLTFFINVEGFLECRELGAIVDPDQDIGCLNGLFNKLVIKSTAKSATACRSVLVPYGEFNITQNVPYAQVVIRSPLEAPRGKYFCYRLDEHLRTLQGPQNMLPSLYRCYLHAITGYVLPDSFTGRLGTEEALRGLHESRLMTPMPLDPECISVLNMLSALTPKRKFYPVHLRVMQTVKWNPNLSQLLQHDEFRAICEEIFEHASKFSPFHDELPHLEYQLHHRGDSDLLSRARRGNFRWRCADFGGALAHREELIYEARDSNTSGLGRQVYKIAALIRDWPVGVNDADILTEAGHWSEVSAGRLDWTCTGEYNMFIPDVFGALYDFCRDKHRDADLFRVMSLFCMVTYGGKNNLRLIRAFLAIAFSGQLRNFQIPSNQHPQMMSYPFFLEDGENLIIEKIQSALEACHTPFSGDALTFESHEVAMMERERNRFMQERSSVVNKCCRQIAEQWPCASPVLQVATCMGRIRLPDAANSCRQLCTAWYRNKLFLDGLREVQRRVCSLPTDQNNREWPVPPPRQIGISQHSAENPTLEGLIMRTNPTARFLPLAPVSARRDRIPYRFSADSSKLRALVFIQQNPNHGWKDYGNWLAESITALENSELPCDPKEIPIKREILEKYQRCLEQRREDIVSEILRVLLPEQNLIPCKTLFWPCITVHSLLSFLSGQRFLGLPPGWKHILVSLGSVISSIRRCRRLLYFLDRHDVSAFYSESENIGQEGWDPMEDPYWILLEIENNVTIRKGQAVMAHEICANFKGNFVTQLNMGEGKTSLIIPMVVSKLANGRRLVRVIVLKPLLHQTLNLLLHRLGRLINRPIYHFPFYRNTAIDTHIVFCMETMYSSCEQQRGVVISLPEHILSFRLAGMDLCFKDPQTAQKAMELDRRLQHSCHDIVDESDEVLHTRFQLVYAMGGQGVIDGGADRWEVSQKLLSLLEVEADLVLQSDPDAIEVARNGERFPTLRFLKPEAIDKLTTGLLGRIEKGEFPGVPFNQWPVKVRESALNFIRTLTPSADDRKTVEDNFGDNICFNRLLMLRGLFAHQVLKFVLQDKRWRVEYGVHRSRCMMAVPFRAKDVPSPNSEFSHPDVAILLTCLSYYYKGLSADQFRSCFSLLARENDGATEYQNWISRCRERLPTELHKLTGVNLDDSQLFQTRLYPIMRYQKAIADFYLSRVVFPREAKQFARKLCTSSWDIPSRSSEQATTGFSGTNDNRSLLPLSIEQNDLPHLLHTNAMVLDVLLKEENQTCVLAQDDSGLQLRTAQLLQLIGSLEPGVRVLIDVGAQVLELENHEVTKQWLKITPEAEAAIYFDDRDEAMVIDHSHHIESLVASSFQERLDTCLVFLDQHHSRGVDLRLPTNSRAAVTLAPRLTKDKLVQACYRLRKLGNGQSVVFMCPPQVRNRMRELSGKTRDLDSADVIRWMLVETCENLDALRPLWASQGVDYCRRRHLWDSSESDDLNGIIHSMQAPEARSLRETYALWDSHTLLEQDLRNIDLNDPIGRKLHQAWENLNLRDTSGHAIHEEQEREIAREAERECQVERPRQALPAPHEVHPFLCEYALHGTFPNGRIASAFKLAFNSLRQTTARRFLVPDLFPQLLVTDDFIRTIKTHCQDDDHDEFVKPVNWVLSSRHQHLVILSQHEANELMPMIRQSKNTSLGVYAPKTTKAMPSFRDLNFLSIGLLLDTQTHLPVQELEFFAGSVYFDTFSLYRDFRTLLGLITDQIIDFDQNIVSNDSFVDEEGRKLLEWPISCPFKTSSLHFVNALTSIQRRGQAFQQSHLASIIDARTLTRDDFDD